MKNNTNHKIATLFNELSSGQSIKPNDSEFPIVNMEQLDGLGLYLQFNRIVNEANE